MSNQIMINSNQIQIKSRALNSNLIVVVVCGMQLSKVRSRPKFLVADCSMHAMQAPERRIAWRHTSTSSYTEGGSEPNLLLRGA